MDKGQEFIEWLIDVLPSGYEWMGRPIVALGIPLAVLAAIVAAWITWHAIRKKEDGGHERRR